MDVRSVAFTAESSQGLARETLDRLVQPLYHELRTIARRQLRARRASDSLTSTALVHEAYLRLARGTHGPWAGRAHFLAVAAIAMRHLLVNRAKAHARLKRGGTWPIVTLEGIEAGDSPVFLLELNDALDRLAALDERLVRVVECRFFGGLSDSEIAEALGITSRTVGRDWVKARALLRRMLTPV